MKEGTGRESLSEKNRKELQFLRLVLSAIGLQTAKVKNGLTVHVPKNIKVTFPHSDTAIAPVLNMVNE